MEGARERKRRESLACRAVIEARASRLAAAKYKALAQQKAHLRRRRPQLPPRTLPSPARPGSEVNTAPNDSAGVETHSSDDVATLLLSGEQEGSGAVAPGTTRNSELDAVESADSEMSDDNSSDEDNPVEVRLFIHEAQKLYASDADGASDPYVRVTCFGTSKDTRVIDNDLNPFFDELLTFTGTRAELSSPLTLEVFDYDFMVSDDLIGAYVFDLAAVVSRVHKEYYKAWVTLLDTTGKRAGPQGTIIADPCRCIFVAMG